MFLVTSCFVNPRGHPRFLRATHLYFPSRFVRGRLITAAVAPFNGGGSWFSFGNLEILFWTYWVSTAGGSVGSFETEFSNPSLEECSVVASLGMIVTSLYKIRCLSRIGPSQVHVIHKIAMSS